MRRIFSIILVFILLTCSTWAAVNVAGSATGCMVNGSVGALAAGAPLTVAAWHKLTDVTSLSYEVTAPSGFALIFADNGNCTGTGVAFYDFAFVFCTTLRPTTNAWFFEAAVVNAGSTQVHFLHMTAAGVVTTQNVTHAVATSASSTSAILGSNSTSCTFPTQGALAQVGIWKGSALTDAELQAFARGGPLAVGRAPTDYYPLFFSNPPATNMGDYGQQDAAGVSKNRVVLLQTGGTAGKVSHCPCGDPF